MMIEGEEFVDWRGHKVISDERGGWRAAIFVFVVEVLENIVFLGNAIAFVEYFIKSMHYGVAEASNMVTNFCGSSFLLTLLGGFIGDSILTRFTTLLISCAIEFAGLVLLTIQANYKSLQPEMGEKPSKTQEAVLYIGLYVMALGIGGIKSSLAAHGADQFSQTDKKSLSAYFNWFFFSLCSGGFIASTIMVWLQENKGWKWNFVVSAIVLCLAFATFASGFTFYRYKVPAGSPITRILKVLFALVISTLTPRIFIQPKTSSETVDYENASRILVTNAKSSHKFRFLNKALVDGKMNRDVVDETKTFLGLLPIFASTILMHCCLSQLQTFSVQQGSLMNRKIKNFQIPTQSLTVLPLTIMLASTPTYEIMKSYTNKMFHPLRRIGLGLALASVSMAIAAAVEVKRREAFNENEVIISVFWLSFQYLLLGVSDMLTLGGMLEFFYSESPERMKSICTSLSWCSTSMGYFFSSVLVNIVNSVSRHHGKAWLGGTNLNNGRLDLFYTILCVLNFINFFNYLFWAKRY